MANVGSANVEITAEDRQARQTVGGFMGFLKKTGSLAAGIAGGFALIETAKSTFSGLYSSTIGANASMETYRGTLATVLKSWERADQTLAWVEKFAAQTPFEIPELVEATTRLETYGITASDTLGTIGDMASVMGKPLMQAVEAVADAQTGELERLKEFGITKQMLIDKAAEMGKKEVVNASGQITDMKGLNEALFAIMRERYEGGMDLQSQTFNGMISNIKDNMGTIASEMSKPVFDGLKKGLKSVMPALDGFKAYIKGDWSGGREIFADLFSPETALKIENGILYVQSSFQKLKQVAIGLAPVFVNLWNVAQNVAPIFLGIGKTIFSVFVGLVEVITPIAIQITKVASAITGWQGFVPIVMGLITAFVSYRTIMAGIITVQRTYATITAASTTALRIWSIAMRAAGTNANFLRKAKMLLTVATRKLNIALLMNPFVLVVAAVLGLVAALVVAYKRSETFRNIIDGLWKALKLGFQAVINWFTVTLPQWISSVIAWFQNLLDQAQLKFQSLWQAITQIFNSIKLTVLTIVSNLVGLVVSKFNSFVSIIKTIIQPFVTFFVNTFNNLKLLVLSIVTAFLSLLIGDFEGFRLGVRGILTALKNQAVNIWTLFKNTFIKIAVSLWNTVKSKFVAGKNTIVNTVKSLGTTAVRLFTNLKNSAIKAFVSLYTGSIKNVKSLYTGAINQFNRLKTNATNAVNNTKSRITGAFSSARTSAVNSVKNLYYGVRDWIGKVPSKVSEMKDRMISRIKSINLRNMGRNVIRGFINGIGDMIGSVKTKVGNVVDALKSKLESKLKMKSPSRLLREYGNLTFEGYVIGSDEMIGDVQKAAGRIADASIPKVDFGKVGRMFSNVVPIVTRSEESRGNGDLRVEVPVNLDGREIARGTYQYSENFQDRRNNRFKKFKEG